jgi:hypothetical protein
MVSELPHWVGEQSFVVHAKSQSLIHRKTKSV